MTCLLQILIFSVVFALKALHNKGIKPLVVGHRGSPTYTPEHTLVSYQLAIDQGADFIEPDLVMTKDGILVSCHENELSSTTNVADFRIFKNRFTRKLIDGKNITGWFTEDFTLNELKQLRVRERIPDIRPENQKQDGMYKIPTLREILELVQRNEAKLGKQIGIYPETKHPLYFKSIGLAFEDPLLWLLSKYGYKRKTDMVMIQSFETWNLKYLRSKSSLFLIQLVGLPGTKPFEFVANNDKRTSQDLLTMAGLNEISKYANGISVAKEQIIPRDKHNRLLEPSGLVRKAHQVGLVVHTSTMRVENSFLPFEFQSSHLPSKHGDVEAEIKAFLKTGIDGFFTDCPDIARQVVDSEYNLQEK
jgi:glycerophosphoryl diester phosphodiesterase